MATQVRSAKCDVRCWVLSTTSHLEPRTSNSELRRGLFLFLFAVGVAGTQLGCRQEMYDQPKYKPLARSDFFADHRASRPMVEGTVARGMLREDTRFYTGKNAAELLTALPVPVTRELLERGRERYNVFCSPCHDRTGSGEGMVVRRGFKRPVSFHEERLRNSPVGYFYDVMSNGFGAMSDYSAQVPPADRWAIVAYIRALQLSQRAVLDDVPASERARLTAPPAPREVEGGRPPAESPR